MATTYRKVYNSAGQHVGTNHYTNGKRTSSSWIVNGKWTHGKDLEAAAPNANYTSTPGHTYGRYRSSATNNPMTVAQYNRTASSRGAQPGTDYNVKSPTLQGLLPGRDLSQGRSGLFGFDKLTYDQFQKGTTLQQQIAKRLNAGGTFAAPGKLFGNTGESVKVTDGQGRSAMVTPAAAAAYNSRPLGSSMTPMAEQEAEDPMMSAVLAALAGVTQALNQPVPEPPAPEPPSVTSAYSTPVGASAQGVKIGSGQSVGKSTKGTDSFKRDNRNAQMSINNLNLA